MLASILYTNFNSNFALASLGILSTKIKLPLELGSTNIFSKTKYPYRVAVANLKTVGLICFLRTLYFQCDFY